MIENWRYLEGTSLPPRESRPTLTLPPPSSRLWIAALLLSWALLAWMGCPPVPFPASDDYHCARCNTSRSRIQWHLVVGRTELLPLTPHFTTVRPSRAYEDLFDARHEHEWEFSNARGSHGVSCGRPTRNTFGLWYETVDSFRAFLAERRKCGDLTDERLRRILAHPYRTRAMRAMKTDPDLRRTLEDARALWRAWDPTGYDRYKWLDGK